MTATHFCCDDLEIFGQNSHLGIRSSGDPLMTSNRFHLCPELLHWQGSRRTLEDWPPAAADQQCSARRTRCRCVRGRGKGRRSRRRELHNRWMEPRTLKREPRSRHHQPRLLWGSRQEGWRWEPQEEGGRSRRRWWARWRRGWDWLSLCCRPHPRIYGMWANNFLALQTYRRPIETSSFFHLSLNLFVLDELVKRLEEVEIDVHDAERGISLRLSGLSLTEDRWRSWALRKPCVCPRRRLYTHSQPWLGGSLSSDHRKSVSQDRGKRQTLKPTSWSAHGVGQSGITKRW